MISSITHEILCQCPMCPCSDDLLPLPRCELYHRAVSQTSNPACFQAQPHDPSWGEGRWLADLLYPTGRRSNSNWGILLSICCCCFTGRHQNMNELSARGCLACSLAGWHGNVVRVVAWFPRSSWMRIMSCLSLRLSHCLSATFCWQSRSCKLCDAGECTPWLSSGASTTKRIEESGSV